MTEGRQSNVLVGVVLLLLWSVAGTVGFVLIEGWSLLDAFYMTIITISTVGYGEVFTLSSAGAPVCFVPDRWRSRDGYLHFHSPGAGSPRGRAPGSAGEKTYES